jgi:DNA-binding Lrp family transcriptional regulator
MLRENRKLSLDKVDLMLLSWLQEDSKTTIRHMADRLGLSTTPVHERIKRLEREGFILGYHAKINRLPLGLSLLVFCDVSLNLHQAEYLRKFEKDILQFPEIIGCYHIAGMFDYLIKLTVADMGAYHHFVSEKLASLENIARVQSSFVMKEVKSEGGLPVGM